MDQTLNLTSLHDDYMHFAFLVINQSSCFRMSDLYSYNDDDDDSPEDFSEEEYNSEDDEFLAFLDADIEAQVKSEFETILAEQIEIVGSLKLYERINQNFLKTKFEPFFAAEQFALYSWREDFFHSSFPMEWWFTDGSHEFDTVPYQVTRNFDKVVDLACSPRNIQDKVYFKSDEAASAKARTLFDMNTVMYDETFLDKEFLEAEGLSFSDAAHVIVAVFQSGPVKLEQLAMKTVIEHQIPMEDVPKELQAKAVIGMHDARDDIPQCINDQGRETFQILRTNFGFTDEDGLEN